MPNRELSREISGRFGIPGYTAHLLVTRGFTDDDQIEEMLGLGEYELDDPFEIKDMDKAVERIERALDSGECIAVFGDYDVDGITATAILFSFLEMEDAQAYYFLPSRQRDGYGLSKGELDRVAECGATLLITVDNGITAAQEIEYAKSLGMDVIVTDHHLPGAVLPDCCAVVNPHREDDTSSFKDLSGAGVAFKLVCALCGDSEMALENYADLVALGTIADIMPLVDENRIMVRAGLASMNRHERKGIVALLSQVAKAKKPVTASTIGFVVGPRINAAGRLGSPERALRLLLSEHMEECARLAAELELENTNRQTIVREIFTQISDEVDRDRSITQDRVLVFAAEGWHRGVLGIIAARVCETYGKPSIIFSIEDGVAHGSSRSLQGFSIHDALEACSSLLLTHGGHEYAGGLSLEADKIPEFRKMINEYATRQNVQTMPELNIDVELPVSHIDMDLVSAAEMLEPYGEGCPQPVIMVKGCKIVRMNDMGGGRHQKLTVAQGSAEMTLVYFGQPSSSFGYKVGDVIDAAFRLEISEFNGGREAQANVIEMKLSEVECETIFSDVYTYEKALRAEIIDADVARAVCPSRDQLGFIYRYMKSSGSYCGSPEILHHRMVQSGGDIPSLAMLLISLEAMSQCGLASIKASAQRLYVELAQVEGRVNIADCAILTHLRRLCEG